MIKVVNRSIRTQKPGACIFNIMRPSVLGNPFIIGQDGDRAEVITKYRVWLWDHIKAETPAIIAELRKIKHAVQTEPVVYLMCCCKPAKCHGDILKACIEWCLNKSK